MATLKEFFLKQKEAARKRSREAFALLREEQMGWRPSGDALTVGEILRHMWTSEEGTQRMALEGDFSYQETRMPKGLGAVMGVPGTLEEELQNLERVHRETMEAVTARGEDVFDEERVNAALGIRRKVSVVLFSINEHEVHHRAVLMVYLRMMGTPVPEPFQLPGPK